MSRTARTRTVNAGTYDGPCTIFTTPVPRGIRVTVEYDLSTRYDDPYFNEPGVLITAEIPGTPIIVYGQRDGEATAYLHPDSPREQRLVTPQDFRDALRDGDKTLRSLPESAFHPRMNPWYDVYLGPLHPTSNEVEHLDMVSYELEELVQDVIDEAEGFLPWVNLYTPSAAPVDFTNAATSGDRRAHAVLDSSPYTPEEIAVVRALVR